MIWTISADPIILSNSLDEGRDSTESYIFRLTEIIPLLPIDDEEERLITLDDPLLDILDEDYWDDDRLIPLEEEPLDEEPLDEEPLDEDPLDEDPLNKIPLEESPPKEELLRDPPAEEIKVAPPLDPKLEALIEES